MSVQEILADLVAIPSLPGTPNTVITECLRSHLQYAGVEVTVLPGPEGDRANLFVTIGPRDRPGYILSGHSDVVSVDNQVWTTDPFRLAVDDGRLTGRGTTDMKGFLACMLAMVPEFAAMPLRRPVHLAFSYDEEIGCRGVGNMISRLPELCAPPAGAIIGEPSGMRPALSHKGKQSLELSFTGKAGHSSNPSLGENAIYAAADMLMHIRSMAESMERNGPFDARFVPAHSTCQAGVVRGGAAVNIIPDSAEIQYEARAIPGIDPRSLSLSIIERIEVLNAEAQAAGRALSATWRETSSYPALPPCADRGFVELMENLSSKPSVQAVSYGTEAGLYHQAGIASIICGPGDIARAHGPDEFILLSELEDCLVMLRGLGAELCRDA
ncbi:acetylornithine deacetylase [Endobacterium cereale]|uniref:acetylornithine deacetylase n=1 Tax=Endobacterium cereale TaxID=2663029 RepID=UPI002B488D6C|nr:acetylornithine deacetylase [Endobacterium cereale]MEB2844437.1 acetylornithine deacetylase [Endobacterium cereale]